MRGSHKVALLTFVAFLSQAASTIASIVLVRFLSAEDYGTYRQSFLIVNTISITLMFSLPASMLYFMPKLDPAHKKGFVIQTLILLCALGSAGSIVSYFLTDFIAAKFNNPHMRFIMPYFSFYILFFLSFQYSSAMFIGLDKIKLSSNIQIVSQIANVAVVIIAALLGANVFTLLKLSFVFIVIQSVITIAITLYQFKGIKMLWDKTMVKKQLSYALPLGLAGLAYYFGKEIDKYCLAMFFNPAVYALYVVGCLEIPFLAEISNSIGSVLVPKMSGLYHEGRKNELLDLWKETIRKSTLFFIPTFTLFLIVAQAIIVTLYTKEYIESAKVFQIYLLIHIMRIFNSNSIIQAIGKTKIIFFNTIFYLVSNTVLNIVAIKYLKLGILGPAIATIITFYLVNFLSMGMAMYYLRCSIKDIFPVADFIKIAVGCVITYIVSKSIVSFVDPYFYKGLVGGICFCIVFGICAWLLKILTKDDMEIVFGKIISKLKKS